MTEHPDDDWSSMVKESRPALSDEKKAVRGFFILVLMIWLVFFMVIAMIHLAGMLL